MLITLLRALIGVAFLLGLCWLLSSKRGRIDWRLVGGGLGLQVLLGFLLLKAPGFSQAIDAVSQVFVSLLGFVEVGARTLFGDLLDVPKYGLAFSVLPTIIFFSALTSVLYYLGILQRVVRLFARLMSAVMKLSGAESLAAAANIFVGQTEAPLVVKPYVGGMTRSELMALMTGGMATIAGSVFAVYIAILGGQDDPEAQAHYARLLLTASVMNAPAALLIAKMLVPETEEVDRQLRVEREKMGVNVLDALVRGGGDGLKLALNVGGMLIVFIAVVAMFNGLLGFIGKGGLNGWVTSASGGAFDQLSLEAIAGFCFAPLAWLIGVESADVLAFGQLLGTKVVLNEFVAYLSLGELKAAGTLSGRSVFLATFALCGFANFGSVGIQLAGIGGIAPGQRENLARLGMKALLGGTVAGLLTTTIAGLFYAAPPL